MSRFKKILTVVALLMLPISLIANVLMYLRYSPRRALVVVGNRKISKYDYEQALDEQAGKQVLNKLVYTELITQAASRAGLAPTDVQVDARLAEMKQLAPQAFETAISQANSGAYRESLRTQMEMENLRMQNISASDAEVAEFYDAHKAAFAPPPQTVSIMVVTQKAALAATAEHLLGLGLTAEALARQPGLNVNGINGFSVNTQAIPANLQRKMQTTLFAMQPKAIKTFAIGSYFFTFKVISHNPGHVVPLSQVKDLVARQVRLQKSPDASTEMVRLYQTEKPQILNARYSAYFKDIEQADLTQPKQAEKSASAQ